MDRPQDRHADRCQGFGDRRFLAAPYDGAEPGYDRATLYGDAGIPRVDRFVPPRRATVQQHHFDPFRPQGRRQRVVFGLLLRQGRDDVAAPVPALAFGVAITAQMFQPHRPVDDVEFVAGPVHQHLAQPSDIIVAAPTPAPDHILLSVALEGRFGVRREGLDGHVVAVFEFADGAHALGSLGSSVRVVVTDC